MRLRSSAALLVLLWAAGCGGEDSSFTEDYNRAVRPIASLGGDLEGSAAEYDDLAERTRRTGRNLARLDPPDGASDELRRLRAGLARVTRSLEDFAGATRAKDPVLQRQAAQRLVRSNEEFGQAETALHRAVGG
jgi:hypothetical protein